MPNGPSRGKTQRAKPRFDAADVEAEIERNRVENDRFQREYSQWFESHATMKANRKRKR